MKDLKNKGAMPKEMRDAIARLKGRELSDDAETVKTSAAEILPISKEIAEEERLQEAARKKAEEEKALKNPQPGQMIAGQGVFLGQWQPKDRGGKSLGKIFNVFAAPQDLTGGIFGWKKTFKYVDAVKRIAKLKAWNGFDGTNYATDKELYQAIEDGSYDGGWLIPTRDILVGTDIDGNTTQPDNLFAHQNKGAFKGTFKKAASSDFIFSDHWYHSSTEHRDDPSAVWAVRFSDDCALKLPRDIIPSRCRPVRVVEVLRP
jgi:hypothetical protein